jgi:alkylhydroperoxidase family enzyme
MKESEAFAPRIAPVRGHTPELDEILGKTEVRSGVALLLRTLANNPRLVKRFNVLAGGLVAKGSVSDRARELVILRTAYRCQSIFEFGQHTVIGMAAGVTLDEVHRITQPLEEAGFNADDNALLQMVDDLADFNCTTDETWDALSTRWSDAQMIELLMLSGFYSMIAGIVNSVRVEQESDVPGWPSSDVDS